MPQMTHIMSTLFRSCPFILCATISITYVILTIPSFPGKFTQKEDTTHDVISIPPCAYPIPSSRSTRTRSNRSNESARLTNSNSNNTTTEIDNVDGVTMEINSTTKNLEHSTDFDVTKNSTIPNPIFPTPRLRRQRVAVCICGTARTFHYRGVHNNINAQLISRLRRDYKTDLFFVTRLDDDVGPGRAIATTRANATLHAILGFDPAQFVLYDDTLTSDFFSTLNGTRYHERVGTTPVRIEAPHTCNFPTKSIPMFDFSHTLFRTKHCLHVIRQREHSKNVSYDWIYRIRPDVVYLDKVPLPSQLNDPSTFFIGEWPEDHTKEFAEWWRKKKVTVDAGNGAVGDQIFVTGRRTAEIAFKAYDIVDDCEAYGMPRRNVEASLRMYLVKHGIRYERMIGLRWLVVRDSLGPQCSQFERIPFWNTTVEERTGMCKRFAQQNAGQLPQ